MIAQNGIKIFARTSKPYGKSWEEWTEEWWKWILSIPRRDNPGYGIDPTSSQSNGNVFFLAGTFGGSARRIVNIPSNKALFFPIINFTTSYAEDFSLKDDEQMLAEARKDIDDIIEKKLVIDGVQHGDIEKYRIPSKPFKLHFPDDNVFGARPGPTTGVSDGYWIFLEPLPVGHHKIWTLGSCSSGRTKVDVTYDLHIK